MQIAGIGPCLYTLAQLSHSNYTCYHGNAPKSIEISLFCNSGSIFHHSTSFSTTGPRDEQFLIIIIIIIIIIIMTLFKEEAQLDKSNLP